MHFLNRMTLRRMLAILVALAVALLMVIGGAYSIGQFERWKSASETSEFIAVMLLASRYVHETQRERGLSAGYLAGANTLEMLQRQRTNTDVAVAGFESAGRTWRGIGQPELAKIVGTVSELQGLRARVDARSLTFGEAAAAYTAIIATNANALSATSSVLAAASSDVQLVATSFAYMDLEWAKEFHGRERAQTNAILGARAMNAPQRDLLMGTRALGRNALALVHTRRPEVATDVERATRASGEAVNRYREAIAQENFSAMQPAQWWEQITAYIDGMWSVMEVQADQIRSAAKAEAEGARNLFVAALALVTTGILVFGGLAWAVASRLNRALGEMRSVITEVERTGDFTMRMTYAPRDEVGHAATAFNGLIAQFAAIIREVQQSGEAIADASRDMAASGDQVTRSSSVQYEAATTVAAAVEQTSVSISETANNARDADVVVERARAQIDLALSSMRKTVVNVDGVANLIRDAGNNVSQLDEGSKKIGGIVQVIKEIAEQTNLLALNAAIEAARAGEQGRGFAVVADEVRKLAERTSQATGQIAELIRATQSQVNSTVAGIREANAQTDESLDLVARTEAALQTANDDSATAAENVRSIAYAVREQDAAVHQVADNIERIAQMSEENNAAARSAADAALRLDELSGKLHRAVARYRG